MALTFTGTGISDAFDGISDGIGTALDGGDDGGGDEDNDDNEVFYRIE